MSPRGRLRAAFAPAARRRVGRVQGGRPHPHPHPQPHPDRYPHPGKWAEFKATEPFAAPAKVAYYEVYMPDELS